MNVSIKTYVLTACILLSTGCAIFPYEEDFACEAMNDFGRCLDVDGAYHVAITGEKKGMKIEKEGAVDDIGKKNNKPTERKITNSDSSPYLNYQSSVYEKTSRLLHNPKTPMVKPADVVRVLVLNYKNNKTRGNPLFMHRYIYFFGSEPQWVLNVDSYQTDETFSPLMY